MAVTHISLPVRRDDTSIPPSVPMASSRKRRLDSIALGS
jgi:hypothetical protein